MQQNRETLDVTASGGWVRQLLMLITLLSATANVVSAQLSVRVVDGQGAALPSVRVDVMGRGEVLEVVVTSTDGTAVLSEARWGEVRRISVSHVGYATRLVAVEDLAPDMEISLQPDATAIEGFVVDAEALCPVVDDSDARALWEAVASRYSPATGERALSARMSRTGGPVRSDALHQWVAPDTPTMVFGRGGDGLGANGRWARGGARVASEGYAWEPVLVGGIGSSRFLNWAYLDLHHDEAAHLVTDIFGARHVFSVSGDRGGQTTLVFCPVDGAEPNIRGTLVLAPDTSLLRADWRFGTPHDDEGAGGWAEFTSLYAPTDELPHLVPARGAYFRHGGTDPQYPDLPRTYLREVVVYHDWFVHGGAKHPCHTERGGGYNLFGETPESGFAKEFVRCVGRFIPPR